MNKVERVRAALRGEAVDHVPASFWFHFPQEQAVGKASVQAHLDYYRASGVDFLKVMNEHPYRPDEPIRTAGDWRKLRPAPLSAPFYREQLDELKAILDGVGGECLVINTIFGPFASGNHASEKQVMAHLKEDPEAVSQGLGAIAESLGEFSRACIEAGAAGIYFSAQGGEENRFTEEEFNRFIKPHDLTALRAFADQGEFNLLHVCRERVRLHFYSDYPSQAVNWAVTKHNPSLREGRELFGRTVMGGLDDRGVVVSGPEEAIRQAVQGVIEEAGAQGIMIGADCTLPTEINVSHIRAAVEATRRWSQATA